MFLIIVMKALLFEKKSSTSFSPHVNLSNEPCQVRGVLPNGRAFLFSGEYASYWEVKESAIIEIIDQAINNQETLESPELDL